MGNEMPMGIHQLQFKLCGLTVDTFLDNLKGVLVGRAVGDNDIGLDACEFRVVGALSIHTHFAVQFHDAADHANDEQHQQREKEARKSLGGI